MAGPLTTVVGLFTAPLRDLVNVLDARITQLQEQGETVPEPESEAPAEEPAAEAETTEPEAAVEEAPAEEAPAEEPAQESNEEGQEE